MTEEKILSLLNHLASIGLKKNSQFERAIRNAIDSGTREFNTTYDAFFNKEKVQFDLEFEFDLQFYAYRLNGYRANYWSEPENRIISRKFSPTPRGICNMNLAYQIVSGRLDDLFEKIQTVNLQEFPGIDAYSKLERILSSYLNQFELKCSRNDPEGFIEYVIPVSKIEGWYHIDKYKATLTPYPSIIHGTFNGIDSQRLEEQMRLIDWFNDKELFSSYEYTEPELMPKVAEVQEKIYRLSQDKAAANVADLLQLKYWRGIRFFENKVSQSAWDYLDTLSKREQKFPVEVPAKLAFNSLCGRAVHQREVYPLLVGKPAWIRFDFTMIGPNGSYVCEVIPGFDRESIEAVLQNIPIPSDQLYKTIDDLMIGDIVPITLPSDKKIFLVANPEHNSVNVYSENMRPIMVNLSFDPAWKPGHNPELNPEELKRKPRQNTIQSDNPPDKSRHFKRRR